MADKSKIFRSLIKKYFPIDLLIKLSQLTLYHDVDNNTKTDEIKSLLEKYKVPYTSLGNGTNRYGVLIDGYAVKIALDRMGKIDNKREFKYAKKLYPSVVKVYECTEDGLIATFEYISIFTLYDLGQYQEEMREILTEISQNYLVGDIGISSDNYINWGIREDGSIAILDFAYIYSLSYRGFVCTCEDEGTLQFDKDFNYLICPICRKKYTFADIRRRISSKDEIEEIGDIKEIGYVLNDDVEELEIDPEKTPIEESKKKKKKERPPKEEKQNWDLSEEEIENILDQF